MNTALLVVLVLMLFAVDIWASVHVIVYKRDPRGAVAWLWAIWMTPILGVVLYVLMGINRIQRKANLLRRRRMQLSFASVAQDVTPEDPTAELRPEMEHLRAIARVGDAVTGGSLLPGNRIEPLVNGEEAYPAMLAAIDEARSSVALLAYIFEKDAVGDRFIEAMVRAHGRGVGVRVLLDAIGCGDTLDDTVSALEAGGVGVAQFLPVHGVRLMRHVGLRNHRKALIVDGSTAFIGGMNVRESHLVAQPQAHHETDVQFRVAGPVVAKLQEVFADDWAFSTAEVLQGDAWFPSIAVAGNSIARAVPYDPGERRDSLRWLVAAAVSSARSSVRIVTPYFLPDAALTSALGIAALRGVKVEIILPASTDVRLVQWACTATLWQVVGPGSRVWLSPPPFDHAKLIVVDEAWTFFGSANLDPRSLRLCFELNVECYDPELAASVTALILSRRERAREVTLAELDSRPLTVRVRDGAARLLTPFL